MKTNNKQYIVYLYQEHYHYKYKNNINERVYCYERLCDTSIYKVFDNIDKAKEFIDNYNYNYELNQFELYIDVSILYEFDSVNEINFEKELYSNGLDYKEIAKENNIEIKF